MMNRREAIALIGAAAAGTVMEPHASAFPLFRKPTSFKPTSAQDHLLEEITRGACLYFWEQASYDTGQVRDRALAQAFNSVGRESRRTASIAGTGFGLTALCIADKRGYIPAKQIRDRVLLTLDYHLHKLPHQHGWFFHFNDMETGQRAWGCELSTIDTALLLCGVLTAKAHFKDDPVIGSQVVELADGIYHRVDFPWFLDQGSTFSMGWTPEFGFLRVRWDHYCELMALLLLAMASPTHPIAGDYWQYIRRPEFSYDQYKYISGPDPLFIHQYSHAWFDFRNHHDKFANYFENSVTATKAHKAFCLSMPKWYTNDMWGISASDTARGYQAWGGPPALGHLDGSLVPSAPAGSLPFLPDECLRTLMYMRKQFPSAWGRYGFVDAFNPHLHWYDTDVLGIDQGITALMSENLRTGFVWETFMSNPEMSEAMKKAGFKAD